MTPKRGKNVTDQPEPENERKRRPWNRVRTVPNPAAAVGPNRDSLSVAGTALAFLRSRDVLRHSDSRAVAEFAAERNERKKPRFPTVAGSLSAEKETPLQGGVWVGGGGVGGGGWGDVSCRVITGQAFSEAPNLCTKPMAISNIAYIRIGAHVRKGKLPCGESETPGSRTQQLFSSSRSEFPRKPT